MRFLRWFGAHGADGATKAEGGSESVSVLFVCLGSTRK